MLRKAIIGLALAGASAGLFVSLRPVESQINTVKEVSPGVYFHEGDLHGHGHCNNGWVVFDDYVVVVDANFPSGAQVIIPKIKALTSKPIRFAFDTHHHGDHAYGNQVWVDNGAIPVAHEGVIREMKKYETGHYGGRPGRWEEAARTRADVAASKLKPPTLLFPKEMAFDDGKTRMELKWFGVAHTHGDGWAWLPKERILFSGDACVNGPYNYTGDGNIGEWIETLENAKKLKPKIVVPGHGPIADASLLEDQRQYFLEIQRQGRLLYKHYRRANDAATQVNRIRANVLDKGGRLKKYVGDMFAAQIEKAYTEAGGEDWPKTSAAVKARNLHAADHRLNLRELGPPMQWSKKKQIAAR